MGDFIDNYVAETAKVPSPQLYRLWAAITAISGVLERKVWTAGSAGAIYPNLFTLLVGPPTSGKTNAINPIRQLWSKITDLKLSPDNTTKASLIDVFARSLRTVINSAASASIFSSLVVPCPEFGVFLSKNDLEFLSFLAHIYDGPETYSEERRSTGFIEITKPNLILLGGIQPDTLSSLMPEEAWGQGFTSRLIMIYADRSPKHDLFSKSYVQSPLLLTRLKEIFNYKGEFSWSNQAIDELNAWNNADCPPTPTHNKLLNYNGRRAIHTLKLAMISCAARTSDLHVTVEDFERGRDWLLEAEIVMPDVFKAMRQRSDSEVIASLHFHLYRKWASVPLDKRIPLKDKDIYDFLHTRIPSASISKIIEVAEKTGYIRKGTYPDEWVPLPINYAGGG